MKYALFYSSVIVLKISRELFAIAAVRDPSVLDKPLHSLLYFHFIYLFSFYLLKNSWPSNTSILCSFSIPSACFLFIKKKKKLNDPLTLAFYNFLFFSLFSFYLF